MNTPRTDAFEKQRIVEAATNDIATEAWADFARQLERENEKLTSERDVLKIEYECRAEWIAKMVKILGCENKDGFNCKDAHWTAEELVRQNERLREALLYIARCPMGSHLKLEDAPELARKALAAQLVEAK